MHESKQRDKAIRRVIIIEGSANLLVLITKASVGLATGSLAVLADAVHSLTDVANNVVAWIVIRLSQQPADREHPYGHRKYETLAVFGLATLLAVLAFELLVQAIKREDSVVVSEGWGLALMLGVLVVNISLATWQRQRARVLKSDILLADASHTFADVLTTIVVIVGWQLSAMGYVWLDRVCAFAVALLVLYLSYGLFKRVVPVLVDEFAIEPERLIRLAQSVEGVKSVLRVRSRYIGSAVSVDLVITVDQGLSTVEAHDITEKLELLLQAELDVKDISIHVEPETV